MLPVDATVSVDGTYEVTCDGGFTISGSSTMTCVDGGDFDQTPTCLGKMQKR